MSEEMRLKHLNYLFLNTSITGTAAWKRVKKSTDFAIAYNAETETYDYIADASPTDELKSYKPSIAQTQTAVIGDDIYDFIAEIARAQKVGSEAVTQAMIVRQQKNSGNTANLAEKFDVLITIDTDDMVAKTITYTISQRGGVTLGTAAISEDGVPTFTADATA